MSKVKNFDEALEETRSRLGGEAETEEASAEEKAEEAKEAAETEKEKPAETENELEKKLEALAAENRALREALLEQSEAVKAEAAEMIEPPAFNPEDENYCRELADYVRKSVMNELSPYIEDARRGRAEREEREALEGLSRVPELAGIMGMSSALRSVIESNPVLAASNAPVEDKLITAFAIIKGADAVKNPSKNPSREDWLRMYENDGELQKEVERLRARKAASAAVELPPMSASAGAASAALTPVKSRPRDFEEARVSMLERLGLR